MTDVIGQFQRSLTIYAEKVLYDRFLVKRVVDDKKNYAIKNFSVLMFQHKVLAKILSVIT